MEKIIMTQDRKFSDCGFTVTQGIEGEQYEVAENTARFLFAKGWAVKAEPTCLADLEPLPRWTITDKKD